MKRCDLFRALSREHRRAVREVERLCRALERSASSHRTVAAFLEVWATEIVPHQRKEEEVLIPEYAGRVSEFDAIVVLTQADHVVLRSLVREMAHAPEERTLRLAAQIAAKIGEHLQFEERTLFPALKSALGATRLRDLCCELYSAASNDQQAVRGA
jgi:hemerythrin-like domain-containing protein